MVVTSVVWFVSSVNAQGMMGNSSYSTDSSQTSAEEAQGLSLWNQLQTKQITCSQLTDDDFDKLGDYFMGAMMGSSHEYMDQIMTNQIGADNERLIHIAMGKRLSGCDTSAAYPNSGYGYIPMMQMMGGWYNGGYNMMNFGLSGWIFTLASTIWLVVGILAAVWLWKKIR